MILVRVLLGSGIKRQDYGLDQYLLLVITAWQCLLPQYLAICYIEIRKVVA